MSSIALEVIRLATEKLEEIGRQARDLFAQVDGLLDWVPEFLSDLIEPILNALQRLNDKLTEFWEAVNEFVTQTGNPERLREVGGQWFDAVAQPLGNVADDISLDKLRTTVEWKGSAAESYRITVPAQGEGLKAIQDLGIQMRDSMNALADGIESFWVEVYAILAGLGIALVAALAAACTVAGILPAIAALATAVGAAVAGVFAAIGTVETLTDNVANQQTSIATKMHAVGASWPRTDASVMADVSEWDVR